MLVWLTDYVYKVSFWLVSNCDFLTGFFCHATCTCDLYKMGITLH